MEGYKISLVEIISQNFSSPQVSKKEEEELIVQDEIKEILKKTIASVENKLGQSVNSIFMVLKKF